MVKNHKSYTNAFKLKLLAESKIVGKNAVSKKYNVPRRYLNHWYHNEHALEETPRSQRARRAIHKQRTGKYHELESTLHKWVIDQRENQFIVDGNSLKLQALKIAAQRIIDFPLSHNVTGFSANNGLIGRFLKRHNLVRRRITTSGREMPVGMQDILRKYIAETRSFASRKDAATIVNMDETTFYLDMFGK
jgi:hypothetical protein